MIPLRRIRAIIIVIVLTVLSAKSHLLFGQSQLEFGQKILYSDSIFSSSNALNVRVLLLNNSNLIADEILVTYSFDSISVDTLLFLDSSFSLGAKAQLDTFINFQVPFSSIGVPSRVRFQASTATSAIDNAFSAEDVFIEVLPAENAIPNLTNYIKTTYKRFNEYLPIEFDLTNTGKVDFYTKEDLSVLVKVNNKSASIVSLKMPAAPLLASQRSSIKFKDSILVSNQFFKKGGGNIVVVWPVGFLQTDSIFDTLIVDWALAQTETATKDWFIYPNPATNEIRFSGPFENVEQVRIIDSQGQIFNLSATGNQIKLPNLNPGIYTLCIFQEQKLYKRVFIISK